jgi:hypothetical protein
MTGRLALIFRHCDAGAAQDARDLVEKIYRGSYSDDQQQDPFSAGGRWMQRFDAYTAERGFSLVMAFTPDGEPAAQAWGWPLYANTTWWDGLEAEPDAGFSREDGTRTFAVSEIMVCRAFIGRGTAHALHDELLRGRAEERGTLLVRPSNAFAYRAYTSWGWRQVARLRPGWPDAPLFDVLILSLPYAKALTPRWS